MADIDTSTNRDPHPTRDELLAIRDRMNARLAAGEPVRLIRVANLLTRTWQASRRIQRAMAYADLPETHRPGSAAERCRLLAETGEHLGLDRVGLVIETVEVRP